MPTTTMDTDQHAAEKRKLEEEIEEADANGEVAETGFPARKREKLGTDVGPAGLFLDTVNRYMLDFDFEKLCSVSLSNLNVYACLVCGKYYQGNASQVCFEMV